MLKFWRVLTIQIKEKWLSFFLNRGSAVKENANGSLTFSTVIHRPHHQPTPASIQNNATQIPVQQASVNETVSAAAFSPASASVPLEMPASVSSVPASQQGYWGSRTSTQAREETLGIDEKENNPTARSRCKCVIL